MRLLRKFKKKLKKKWILRGKHSARFGLSGTRLYSDGSDVFENCIYECAGANNSITLNGRVNLNQSKIYIFGNNNKIIIGKGSYISNATFWIEGDCNEIKIGNGLFTNANNNFTCIDGKKLVIGDDCLFSSDINFQVGDGHPIYDTSDNRINISKDIVIEDHVWVGKRAIILKGTQIPKGCVIGAGAIVTGKFTEENTVIVGVPAKVVKKDIRWERK